MNAVEKKTTKKGGYAFDKLADEWLQQQQINVKRNTYECYLYISKQLKSHFGDMPIKELAYENIQGYINGLYAKGMAKSTIKKRKLALSGICKYAIKKGILEKNPCECVELPKNAYTGTRRDLTHDEIDILIESKNCKFSTFALFLYYTGMRKSEATPIKWSDIDFDKNEIRITRVVSYAQGKSYIDNFLKNGDSLRIIPISAPLRKMLHSMSRTSEWVFPNTKGNLMARNTVRVNWKCFQEESGLTEVTPHMLRHTFATSMYRAGIDVKTLQKITGHHDIEVLFKKYIHDDEEEVRKSVTLMDKYYAQLGQK